MIATTGVVKRHCHFIKVNATPPMRDDVLLFMHVPTSDKNCFYIKQFYRKGRSIEDEAINFDDSLKLLLNLCPTLPAISRKNKSYGATSF